MSIDERELATALRDAGQVQVGPAELEAARRRLGAAVERRRRDRWRATVAAVVAAVLVVGGGAVWLAERGAVRTVGPSTRPAGTPVGSGPSAPVPTPVDLADRVARAFPDGLVGIPPVGAAPSAPETGTLRAQYRLSGMPFRGSVRLFDDGRMIWYRFHGDQFQRSTGYVEQRLSAEGIRLVTSRADGDAAKDPWNLVDWLPASAWADWTIRPYVPRHFEVCTGIRSATRTTAPTDLSAFPPAVAARLAARATTPSGAPGGPAAGQLCLRLATAEAREVAAALDAAGFAVDSAFVLSYSAKVSDIPARTLVASFEPVFPDGTTGCSPCG